MAGAAAGFIVDVSLYPIDTVKSRLQSAQGFRQAGGFKNVYRGIQPVLLGSMPASALFFLTYEQAKGKLEQTELVKSEGSAMQSASHIIAASFGEFMACTIRAPYEVVKIRSQTSVSSKINPMSILRHTLSHEGIYGLYRGFWSTVLRDFPFSAVEFPIWEKLKSTHKNRLNRPPNALESALYGSIAGGIAAIVTTPVDVAKTRIVLAEQAEKMASGNMFTALKEILKEKGVKGLFAGVMPRTLWMSIGGFLFLGSYEKVLMLLDKSGTRFEGAI